MDRGAWQVTVIGVAKSQTQLGKKAQAQHHYSGRKAESLSSFTVCRLSSAWLVVRSQDGASGLCAQPEVTVLHLGEGLAAYKRTRRYRYVHPLRKNQYSPLAVPLFLFF